ncbi:MAG: hypothetical protein JEY94_03975 [Melioribacteraceae bacterium]|nr:hypothetical protein [Melioribacteraceae bacterium]
MNQFFHILKFKSKAYIRQNSELNFATIIKSVGSLIIYGGFAVGVFFLTKSLMEFMLEEVKLGSFLLHEFLSIVFFIFFLSINAGNIIVSYSTLYKSEEINFLMQKPIKKENIFLLKFLDNFFYSSSTMLLMLFSALSAYFLYYDYSIPGVLAITIFAFLPFLISAGSLGVIILLIIIKLISRFGAKLIIGLLLGSYLTSMFIFFKTLSPVYLVNSVMENYPNVDEYYGDLIPKFASYLPSQWLSDTLYWITQNNLMQILTYIIYINIFAVIFFLIALFLGKKYYFRTWLIIQDRSSNEVRTNNSRLLLSFRGSKWLDGFSNSILKRDLINFFREPSQTLHFIVLMILMIIFMVSLSGVSKVLSNSVQLKLIVYMTIFMFNQFLIITLALRFVFPLMSLEGNTIWKMKSAPISFKKLLWLKQLPFLVLIIILGQFLSLFSNRIFSYDLVIFSGLLSFFSSVAITQVNFGMGALFKNLNEKNPIRLASSQGASLTFLLSIILLVILAGLVIIPLYSYFEVTRKNLSFDYNQFYLVIISWSIFASIVSFIFNKIANKTAFS